MYIMQTLDADQFTSASPRVNSKKMLTFYWWYFFICVAIFTFILYFVYVVLKILDDNPETELNEVQGCEFCI